VVAQAMRWFQARFKSCIKERSSEASHGGQKSTICVSAASAYSPHFLTDRGVETSFLADRNGVRPALEV
jgi:hypothetical protein